MTRREPSDPAASVRARLLNLAKGTRVPFHEVLVRYGTERLLYRLGRSPHRDRFLLKGATLFAVWTGARHRGTKDADLLGYGPLDAESLRALMADVVAGEVPVPDGLTFDPETVSIEDIRGAAEYGGYRVKLRAQLAGAVIPLQVDLVVGEVVTPGPVEVTVPSLLDHDPPRLRAYPIETVIAEKFEAIVKLGLANSRLKDYYDLWYILMRLSHDPDVVARAVAATFGRRGTALPEGTPAGLTDAYANADRQREWRSFLDSASASDRPDLREVIVVIEMKMMPIAMKALMVNVGVDSR